MSSYELYVCTCDQCILVNPNGLHVSRATYQAHYESAISARLAHINAARVENIDYEMAFDDTDGVGEGIEADDTMAVDGGHDSNDTLPHELPGAVTVPNQVTLPQEVFHEQATVDPEVAIDPGMEMANDLNEPIDDYEDDEVTSPPANPLEPATRFSDSIPRPIFFILIFLVLFQLRHISERTASTLISFVIMLVTALHLPEFNFPTTLATIRSQIGFNELTNPIEMYVACSKCHAIYPPDAAPDNCTTDHLNGDVCSNQLFKRSTNRQGRARRTPLKQYAYYSVKASLQKLFMRNSFEEKILEWRAHPYFGEYASDVHHGAMWEEVKDRDGVTFVDHDRSLLLTMNIDWFSPFDSGYSVGAIYLTVNNLPRTERFNVENVILVGVMPGPREPSTYEINNYLRPLVDELQELYNGIPMKTAQCPGRTEVRAALLNVACDIPASRKVCGFTAHSSTRACNKCYREFVTDPDTHNMVYTGVDLPAECMRTNEDNRLAAEAWLAAGTQAARYNLERENGTRWSQLHRLGYFDLIRGTVIDPMHNLFIGTAARMVTIWKNQGILTESVLTDMQTLADRIILPPGMPTLQRKIQRKFGFMTADDWRAWTLAYSPYVLQSVLQPNCYEHWMLFVDACRLVVKTRITDDDIVEAHGKFVAFVSGCERLYGKYSVTPNMHLHLHLYRCLQDHATIYSFWVFAFERYNGFMKDAETNQKDCFELTFMKRFVEKTGAVDFVQRQASRFEGFSAELDMLLEIAGQSRRRPQQRYAHTFDYDAFLEYSTHPRLDLNLTGTEPMPPSTTASMTDGIEASLSDDHYELLLQYYWMTYGTNEAGISRQQDATRGRRFAMKRVQKFRTIEIFGQTYRSATASTPRGSHIQVIYWQDDERQVPQQVAWPGRVQYFFRSSLVVDAVETFHYLAFVRWYRSIPPSRQHFSVGSLEEWHTQYMPETRDCIIPVHRIYSQVAVVPHGLQIDPAEAKMVVIPLPKRITV